MRGEEGELGNMEDLSREGGGNVPFEQGKQGCVGGEVVVGNGEKENCEGQTFQILLMRHFGVDREEKIKLA